MLNEAVRKMKLKNLLDRAVAVNGNIENMKDQEKERYDMVINFHNVLGFINSPLKALKEMSRVLKKGGILVSVVPNKYHGVYFNISEGRLDAAEKIAKTCKGTFHKSMPDMCFFTPENMKKMYQKVDMKNIKSYGFPVALYPSFKETTIKESTKSLKDLLQGKTLKTLKRIEEKLIINEEASSRGNNLFIIGIKK